MPSGSGTLFVLGTPIGNMEDITLRALRVLGEVDLIAAEDTRHTGLLLARHGIKKPFVSYHEFNEAMRTPELLKDLQRGRNIALVSDAGMPTVSDPGQRLIRAAIDDGIHIEIIPGVSAVTTALVASGFGGRSVSRRRDLPGATGSATAAKIAALQPSDPAPPRDCRAAILAAKSGSFLFYGFLPHKSGQRRNALTRVAPLPYTVVFFESPYRLLKTLHDMHEVLGNRHIVVARELTKKFEEILRGDIEAVLKKLENRTIKGEITLVVEGSQE